MSSGSACAPCGTTLLACFGVSRAGGQSGYAESYGAESEKCVPSSSINRHFMLLWDTRELANSRIPRDNSSLCRLEVEVMLRALATNEMLRSNRSEMQIGTVSDTHSNYPQPAETSVCGSAFPAKQG